jgi:hypothetical protein
MRTIIPALIPMLIVAQAQPWAEMPWPNTGNCPHGYFTSNGSCVPSAGAQPAIPKSRSGNCPWGWTSSGDFCLKSGSGR